MNLTSPRKDARFYETTKKTGDRAYFTSSTVGFQETSENSAAGVSYKQSVIFRFPNTDLNRSIKLFLLTQIQYLGLVLTDGTELIIGRNDYTQNTPPKIQTESGVFGTEVKIETESIMPVLFVDPSGVTPVYGYDYVYDFMLA